VTVPLPIDLGNAATAANSKTLAGTPFQQACVVFADAPFLDWAFMGLSSSPPNTNVTTYCYDFLSSLVGAWGMENTHTIAKFGDLYLTSDAPPGNFDNMSCACGVHPSTYTKVKLGWLDASEIVQINSGGATQILHALSLPRPSPPGRFTALRFPTGNSQHYFLIEARLNRSYEAGMPNL
jgi:hypothetical protein